MSVFDLFNKNSKPENSQFEKSQIDNLNFTSPKGGPISVFKPQNYVTDVEKIIDCLKNGKSAIVHLTEIKKESAMRIIDMLSGAVYALGGGTYEMDKNIFMFSPFPVEMN